MISYSNTRSRHNSHSNNNNNTIRSTSSLNTSTNNSLQHTTINTNNFNAAITLSPTDSFGGDININTLNDKYDAETPLDNISGVYGGYEDGEFSQKQT